MLSILMFSCAVITSLICMVLVLHDDYVDGLVGRLALSLISVAAAARAMVIFQTEFNSYPFSNGSMVLYAGLAIFFSRHLYHFLRNIGQWPYSWNMAIAVVLKPIRCIFKKKQDPERTQS